MGPVWWSPVYLRATGMSILTIKDVGSCRCCKAQPALFYQRNGLMSEL